MLHKLIRLLAFIFILSACGPNPSVEEVAEPVALEKTSTESPLLTLSETLELSSTRTKFPTRTPTQTPTADANMRTVSFTDTIEGGSEDISEVIISAGSSGNIVVTIIFASNVDLDTLGFLADFVHPENERRILFVEPRGYFQLKSSYEGTRTLLSGEIEQDSANSIVIEFQDSLMEDIFERTLFVRTSDYDYVPNVGRIDLGTGENPLPPPTPTSPPPPTATQPSSLEIEVTPGNWIWNPYQSIMAFQFLPDRWALQVGGKSIVFVYDNQGLVHQSLENCVFSLPGPWEMYGMDLDIVTNNLTFGGLSTERTTYYYESGALLFSRYDIAIAEGKSGSFVVSGDDGSGTCIGAAELVLNTIQILED